MTLIRLRDWLFCLSAPAYMGKKVFGVSFSCKGNAQLEKTP